MILSGCGGKRIHGQQCDVFVSSFENEKSIVLRHSSDSGVLVSVLSYSVVRYRGLLVMILIGMETS